MTHRHHIFPQIRSVYPFFIYSLFHHSSESKLSHSIPIFAKSLQTSGSFIFSLKRASKFCSIWCLPSIQTRSLSSDYRPDNETKEGGQAEEETIVAMDCKTESVSGADVEAESRAIGFKVIGSLVDLDRFFKPYEPVFAVIQIGSHQFKVGNGDCFYSEKLNYCKVNDRLILNKVLVLGSRTQTIIGRPVLPDAAVHAVVEQHSQI